MHSINCQAAKYTVTRYSNS